MKEYLSVLVARQQDSLMEYAMWFADMTEGKKEQQPMNEWMNESKNRPAVPHTSLSLPTVPCPQPIGHSDSIRNSKIALVVSGQSLTAHRSQQETPVRLVLIATTVLYTPVHVL